MMAIEGASAADEPAIPVPADLPRQEASAHAHAEKHGEDQVSTLGVQIAEQNWLVDMADISGALPLPPLTPVPLVRPWFLGLINVRGMLYGVTDMAAYQKKGKASGTAANRILLVAERHAFNAVLLVDGVLGLRDTRAWEPDKVGGQMQCRDERGNVWRKLDVVDLLRQPDFLQVGI